MVKRAGPPVTKHLGRVSNAPTGELDLVPWKGGEIVVTLNGAEFTSRCPVTKQPDFARIVIQYCPDKSIVETKSMKLYLWGFREKAEFNELLVDFIANDFQRQVTPWWVVVTGEFNARGGIALTATAKRSQE